MVDLFDNNLTPYRADYYMTLEIRMSGSITTSGIKTSESAGPQGIMIRGSQDSLASSSIYPIF